MRGRRVDLHKLLCLVILLVKHVAFSLVSYVRVSSYGIAIFVITKNLLTITIIFALESVFSICITTTKSRKN